MQGTDLKYPPQPAPKGTIQMRFRTAESTEGTNGRGLLVNRSLTLPSLHPDLDDGRCYLMILPDPLKKKARQSASHGYKFVSSLLSWFIRGQCISYSLLDNTFTTQNTMCQN